MHKFPTTTGQSAGFAGKKCRVLAALPVIGLMMFAQACGGGSSAGTDPLEPSTDALNQQALLDDAGQTLLDPLSAQASYRVTVRNFWGADQYPQEFPDNAHFSLFGGAVHDSTFSMWGLVVTPSTGIEDMAETGRIDMLLEEVAPGIADGSVDSFIEVREFTEPQIDGVPGELEFEIVVTRDHPLVSMVSMLGPSPDWFVGADSQSLLLGDSTTVWAQSLVVPLPLYDGGSKSDIIPVMGGPDIIPPNPVGLVAYDAATGTYLPSTVEQIMGELVFTRIE